MAAMPSQAQSSPSSVRPHLSTFIDFARHASFSYSPSRSLPQHFREPQSVASSITIGEGTSFTISRKYISLPRDDAPPPVEQQQTTVSITYPPATQQAQITRVVYKTARVRFTEEGEASVGLEEKYASVLLDFLVLSHESTVKHKNLLTLLGLAWGNTIGDSPFKIPVPIVQYADFGSLADLQQSRQICVSHKSRLLMDIATGLEFLHSCDIVHGDVKSENVLVFSNGAFRYLAKLSDFGSCMPGGQGIFDFVNRGTADWAAPEIRQWNYDRDYLAASDTFSFGLTAWRMAIDGFDPLSSYMLLDAHRSTKPSDRTVDWRPAPATILTLLLDNGLVELAASVSWLAKHKHLNSNGTMLDCGHKQNIGEDGLQEQTLISEPTFLACLDGILNQALQLDPRRRSLSEAKADLEMLNGRDTSVLAPTAVSITSTRQYKTLMSGGFTMSYIALRDIPPQISNIIFSHIVKSSDLIQSSGRRGVHLESCLTAGFMSGFGSDRFFDAEKSLSACLRGANGGITGLQALIYRLAKLIGKNAEVKPLLERMAARGSLAAMEDLKDLDSQSADHAIELLQSHTCGVGATFFYSITKPLTYLHLSNLELIEAHLNSTGESASKIEVNARGDTLIHAAASGGSNNVVLFLLDRCAVPVDLCNSQGETPLLCATRAGHLEVVRSLLDRGASAKIASKRHETVLHWLISISDSALQELLPILILNGADTNNVQWALSCDYAAAQISGYLDRWDHPGAGTPLHWAVQRKRSRLVQQLLDQGAKHDDGGTNDLSATPFEQAAYFQDHGILRVFIESRYPKPRWPCFDCGNRQIIHSRSDEVPGGSCLIGLSGLIRQAIEGSDRYSMTVRWGVRYKDQLRETFRLLGEELLHQKMVNGVDGSGRSPLQYAASRGFHEASEFIYEFMDGPSQINVPYKRGGGTTPIFEAVRRDNKALFNFLLEKGAKVDIQIDSPGLRDRLDWCILHTVADFTHNGDLYFATKLLDLGVPPDGYQTEGQEPTETPLAIAIENNNFGVVNLLRKKGANVNALSRFTMSSNLKVEHPMTMLGRIVASNLRDCVPRLRYLFSRETPDLTPANFVVAPDKGWTALHVNVLGLQVLDADYRQEVDALVSHRVLECLLQYEEARNQVNATTGDAARETALHIAAGKLDLRAVELLLEADAIDLNIKAGNGLSVLEEAQMRVEELKAKQHEDLGAATAILEMLTTELEIRQSNTEG